MALKGYSQMEIADYLELCQSQISRELKQIKDDWRSCAVRDHELERGRTLSKLELVEREFWEAWRSSREQKKSALVEHLAVATGAGDSSSNTRTKKQKRTEDSHGNPAYLRGVLDCVKEAAKILELYPDSDHESNNTTAAGRSSSGGLSGDTVSAIRSHILGLTQHGQPNSAEPDNTRPTALSAEMVSGQESD
jgi:citrate synthase